MNMPPGTRLAWGSSRDDLKADVAAAAADAAAAVDTTAAADTAGAAGTAGAACAMPQASMVATTHISTFRTARIERLLLSCHTCFQSAVRQPRFDLVTHGNRVGVGNQF